jgi:hypothetical protein
MHRAPPVEIPRRRRDALGTGFNSSAGKDKEMAAEKVMAEGLGIGMETVDEGDTWVQLRSK